MSIDCHTFLEAVRPGMEVGDADAVARAVTQRWRTSEVCQLLSDENVDARRVAAIVLGLVGDTSVVPCLTRALSDADEQVNEMAEHGLWTLWFRAGEASAMLPFRRGLEQLGQESYEQAAQSFREAVKADPHFAEAHNQCAIALYLLGRWEASLRHCCSAIELMPLHFGAIAGMGHCYAQRGDLTMALRCYRKALRLNPRMRAIAQAIERLQQKLKDANDASGEFLVGSIPR